jgi:hypothetical protein
MYDMSVFLMLCGNSQCSVTSEQDWNWDQDLKKNKIEIFWRPRLRSIEYECYNLLCIDQDLMKTKTKPSGDQDQDHENNLFQINDIACEGKSKSTDYQNRDLLKN